MVKYSAANLLDEELSFIGSTDFISKMIYKMTKTSTVSLKIEVPLNLYLRAEVLCEDIMELSEMPFHQNNLMNLLYNDFLLHAKKNPDPMAIFNLLNRLEKEIGKESSFQQQAGTTTFNRLQREKRQQMKILDCSMRRKSALRGEVILADMEDVQEAHGYTLERVFELLYIDFIEKFKRGGTKDTIENILYLIDDLH
ncbi:hypothetical protein [Peribacillus aracenensis]|uniref:hypothetical protein n=1 Tax=Peribacillus aracenensis TaxID=2976708 RepID=UPI0021A5AEF6|nr:hypothetical protein [Peribacillus sp. BBB004]